MSDIVRVLRVVEYIGPREWVEEQVRRSIHGERRFGKDNENRIRAATLGEYPEALEQGPVVKAYPGCESLPMYTCISCHREVYGKREMHDGWTFIQKTGGWKCSECSS